MKYYYIDKFAQKIIGLTMECCTAMYFASTCISSISPMEIFNKLKNHIIMKKTVLIALLSAISLSGCGQKQNNHETSEASSPNRIVPDSTLVLYFSQTGATKAVAEELQKQLGCNIASIEPTNPYEGDYGSTIQRWRTELESGTKVELQPLKVDLSDYSTIFLGAPIWGGTYAIPMASFLADNSLEGKRVVTFATFGSGGIDPATADVVAAQPKANVVKGYGVRNARVGKAPEEIRRFLIEGGYLEGDIEPLPSYSESVAVTAREDSIFNAACGDYQFPLGKPVMVATRSTDSGMDYKYEVSSTAPDGSEASSTIYVTVINGEKPEFTEVVRH